MGYIKNLELQQLLFYILYYF